MNKLNTEATIHLTKCHSHIVVPSFLIPSLQCYCASTTVHRHNHAINVHPIVCLVFYAACVLFSVNYIYCVITIL